MIGIGRRSAYTRIAHVLCEVMVKMRAVVKDVAAVEGGFRQGNLADDLTPGHGEEDAPGQSKLRATTPQPSLISLAVRAELSRWS
jgi:hypothetical protein